jgi:hypothetical protein
MVAVEEVAVAGAVDAVVVVIVVVVVSLSLPTSCYLEHRANGRKQEVSQEVTPHHSGTPGGDRINNVRIHMCLHYRGRVGYSDFDAPVAANQWPQQQASMMASSFYPSQSYEQQYYYGGGGY